MAWSQYTQIISVQIDVDHLAIECSNMNTWACGMWLGQLREIVPQGEKVNNLSKSIIQLSIFIVE
jgi:hypothetical protein